MCCTFLFSWLKYCRCNIIFTYFVQSQDLTKLDWRWRKLSTLTPIHGTFKCILNLMHHSSSGGIIGLKELFSSSILWLSWNDCFWNHLPCLFIRTETEISQVCVYLSADVQVVVKRLNIHLSYACGRHRHPLIWLKPASLLHLVPSFVALTLRPQSLLLPIKHLQRAGVRITQLPR